MPVGEAAQKQIGLPRPPVPATELQSPAPGGDVSTICPIGHSCTLSRILNGLDIEPAPCVRKSSIRSSPRSNRWRVRSEEHTSELQSLMRISYAVFCLKKKNNKR